MHTAFKFIILIAIVGLTFTTSAQTQPVDYMTSIKNYDLSKLWRAESIQTEGDGEIVPFPEPLGYTGENYQRFYIHYITVDKSSTNPYQYNVYGKTKVKANICSFHGTITITKAVRYKEPVIPEYKTYKEGTVTCAVVFYKDSTQPSSGIIKGKLTTDFYIDAKGKICYDALMAAADTYCNNQCEATWTSYKTNKSKKCNWGDYRMPDSKKLDGGAGDVSINEKYTNNGWETFVAAYSADEEKAGRAQKTEEAKWW